MFSFCCAQWLSCLQCIIFPSLGILQCYIEFDAHTIAMLKKPLALGSFGTIMGHLACRHVTIFTSLGALGLPLVVRCATLAFLRCWVLIVLVPVSRFQ
jgi:hypothetical protein